MALIVGGFFLFSNGMSFKLLLKNVGSNYNGGLNRVIEVENLWTGKTVWTFEGKAYIDDKSKVGDFTIVYYDQDGAIKKEDFLGSQYGAHSHEK